MLAVRTGSVTSVAVADGSGLTASPGPITTTVTIGTDFSTIQHRVTGACPGSTAIQSVSSTGNVNCSAALAPASKVVTIAPVTVTRGGTDVTLLDAAGFTLTGRCIGGTNDDDMVSFILAGATCVAAGRVASGQLYAFGTANQCQFGGSALVG